MTDQTTSAELEGEKLWAGKYKTPEEMETALQGKDKEYVKLMQTHDDLRKSHSAPENYDVPDTAKIISDEIDTLKRASKNANLSQESFNKIVAEMVTKKQSEHETFEQHKKDVGEQNVTVLEDYVKKNYPETLQKTVLKQLIANKDARSEALKHRETLLNSRAPGMDGGNPGSEKPSEKYDGQAELLDIAKQQARRPQDGKLRDKLINKAREIGEARFKK